ncbi:MAG: RecQ family ATP-dependent DNA helicase [Leptospirillia bacterium]
MPNTPSLFAPPVQDPLDAARAVLSDRFGFDGFREGQEEIISAVLSGRDVMAIMPTGGGKSLCYQLPACLDQEITAGVTLVVSPLIALMKDQVDALTAFGIPAAAVNSSLSFDEVRAVMDRVRGGGIRLLYVAPERFGSRFFMGEMAGVPIARVAVDEAHCVSQWGHDFRPAYIKLRAAVEQLGRPPISAFTATATPRVQDDIAELLGLSGPARFVTGFERSNLHMEVIEGGRKKDMLATFMAKQAGPGIIYCATRKHVEEVTSRLGESGGKVVAYHAGLPDEARIKAQNAFMDGHIDVIVATNAFGMGVDKANVRFVLHYDMPGTLEAYYQEAGRAGRDGKPARCTVLYGRGDRFTQEFFINGSHPTEHFVRRIWQVLEDAQVDGIAEMSNREMLAATGEEGSEFAVSAALKILEQAGGLSRMNPRDNPALIRIADRGKVGKKAAVQQRILTALDFHIPAGESGTVEISLGQLGHEAGIDHDALLRGLNAMNNAGAIDYTAPFRGRGVRLLMHGMPPVDFTAQTEKRNYAFASLDGMEAYCQTSDCRRAAILAHFGELREDGCGACDRCLNEGPVIPEQEATVLAQKLMSGVARCCGRGRIAFGVQTVAAHLAGGNTEAVRKNGLDQVSTYGLLQNYTQKQVADLLNQLAAKGYLRRQDAGEGVKRRPVLTLTEQGAAVLKNEAAGVTLRIPASTPARPAIRSAKGGGAASPADVGDPGLYDTLRGLRIKLAQEADMPAYRVFADRTLQEMANLKPTNLSAMSEIHGVGPSKLETYGETFMAAIRTYLNTSKNPWESLT